ncbi:MAG TPA: AAA family ATPase [Streptosporangiaceae bacterium]|nr:AAA family ATPase [Streptosporangiaceae bacterium]
MGAFVGRADELEILHGFVAGVVGGVGGVVLVSGEQGVGKSALLAEGLAQGRQDGCRIVWGQGEELASRLPLALMTDCLGEDARLALADADGGSVTVLRGDLVLAGVERLLALVDQWCADGPVVVVAEDLQWADEASLLVWERLARATQQLPLLVAGSWRPAADGTDVAGLVRRVRLLGGSVMELEPLPADDVATLAAGLLGGRPGPQLARVLSQAGGNPLYVRELADTLMRDGLVVLAGQTAELAAGTGAVQVPSSLTAAIGERLAALPAQAAQVLQWAAVLGAEFSVTDLAVVTGVPASDLTGALSAAAEGGVLVPAGPRLAFRHGLIRQVLYERLPQAVREALHAQAAQALAGGGAAPERVAAQLAAASAECQEWAREWLVQALPVLTYRAPQVTAGLLRRILADLPPADPRLELLQAALVTVARLLVANEELERVARPLLARTADADRAAEVAWQLSYTLQRTGRPAEALTVAQRALDRPGINPVWRARLRAQLALHYVGTAQWDSVIPAAEEALADAEGAGDRVAAGHALHVLAMMASKRRDIPTGLGYLDRALAVIGDDPQATDLRLLLLANRISGLSDLDRMADVDSTLGEALSLAERAGTPRLLLICVTAARCGFQTGRWDEALTVLETVAELPGSDYMLDLLHGLSAMVAGHRDDRQAAARHLAAVTDGDFGSTNTRLNAHVLLRARALAAEQAGGPGESVRVLARCLDPDMTADMHDRYVLLPQLARAAQAAGDAATAAAAAKAAGEEAELAQLPVCAAAAQWCQGLAERDPEPVLAAAGYYESAGRPVDQAQSLEDAAWLLAERGRVPAARRAFLTAAELYLKLGAAWDLQRAEARLHGYGIRRHKSQRRIRPQHGWEALTATEARIACLVADGRSNPEIAEALFLSRNTVQTHVSHILAKLGARSRTEIVRQALEHGTTGMAAT